MKSKSKSLLVAGIIAAVYGTTLMGNIAQAEGLPKVAIMATGGTIAGSGNEIPGASYKPGALKIDDMIASVPSLKKVADVKGIQIANIASQNMNIATWLTLAKGIDAQCASKDGFVITHGTDTMEETAFFLDHTVKCNKPVVLVGAMRPATSLSADGPANLYNAVVLASDPKAVGRGVMVMMSDHVYPAQDVTKLSVSDVSSFSSPNWGPMATVADSKVTYHYRREQQPKKFDVSRKRPEDFPKVGIFYGYAHDDTLPLKAFIDAGYKGIVSAGMGDGNLSAENLKLASAYAKKGGLLIRATRIPSGEVKRNGEVNDDKEGFVTSGRLNPQKSRILAMLVLSDNYSKREIEQVFKG